MKLLSNFQKENLDAIRYLSCLVVVIGHFAQVFLFRLFFTPHYRHEHPLISIVLDLPTFAVMIFFVLSGFLVTYSAFSDIQKNKEGRFVFFKYLQKRIKRIVPPSMCL